MNAFQKFDAWTDERRAPAWMDLIRVALGLFLFYKGFLFTRDFPALQEAAGSMDFMFSSIVMSHYVSMAHLVGGLLIALGGYVRSMCLVNLPVLLGAVLINYDRFLTVPEHSELGMSLAVMGGLVVFFIYGGGRFSVDELRRRDRKRKLELGLEPKV